MRYPNLTPATFVSRPNRFVAQVLVAGEPVTVHVKNTGRCRELLVPGAQVWLTKSDNPNRKTAYDLIAVEKGARLINMDSQAPNKVFYEWAAAGHFVPGLTLLKAEQKHGDSRFDFYWEAGPHKGFVEVKGVTLERDGAVYFPDAPTQRGIKHLHGLADSLAQGYEGTVCFVIQMEQADFFAPNDLTHPAFGQALRAATQAGVRVLALCCSVTPDSLSIAQPVPVKLGG
ncbi:MAG: DNA/RNA nuclease SfsA [Clostridiales bacterium]|nr:DNA/RNA nuclease SfsA [Clostridiales bacterium]MDY4173416.1 DNA/RNA nuclease SfsA [Evtepia sp.]